MAKVITVDDLNKENALKATTPTPDPILEAGGGIIDSAISSISDTQATLDTASKDQAARIEKLGTLGTDLNGKSEYAATQDEIAGVNKEQINYDKYTQELNDINASISGLSKEAKAIPLKVQEDFKNVGATDRGVAPVQAGRLRENAIKALTASSLADVVIANVNNSVIRYNAAKEKAQKAVDLKYEPIENEIKTLKEQLQLNKDYIVDPAEKKLAAKQLTVLNERERIMNEAKELEKNVSGIALEVAKNGGSPALIKAVSGAKSMKEAIDKAGTSLSSPQTEVIRMSDTLAYIMDKRTGKIIRTLGGGGGGSVGPGGSTSNSKYATVINTILGSGKFTKDQATAVRNAINNGEDAFSVVKNNAKNIMGQTSATKLNDLETSRDAFNDFASSLQAFYDAGGKTSYVKGNLEKMYNKFGTVDDPKLAGLAIEVQANIQKYRNAISGTAYSEQEGKDITSIFPGINKSQGLNDAIVNARKKLFDASIDSSYRGVLGSSYDELKNEGISKNGKGTLSDRDFVAKAFVGYGKNYEQVVNATPAGQIPVVDNATGQIGYIPYTEFNNNIYTKL